MSGKILTALKIFVAILFVVALGMGGWFVYTKFFGGEDGGQQITGEQIELEWWVLWEEEENLQVLADAYNQENPNVTIRIVKQELKDLYKEKVLGQISDNSATTGPDIFRMHNTWLPQFQQYLSSLPSSTMSETEYKASFYDTAYRDFSETGGQVYAIPLMFDGLGVYYNKTLLLAGGYTIPEDTWDDFLLQAQALTQYESDGSIKVAGAGIGSENNVDFFFEIISLLMLQEGATMVDSTGKTTFGTDSEMRAAKALKYYTDYVTRYEIWNRSLDRDIQMFAEGRLAMMFAPAWRVHDINNALETYGTTLDYNIAPVPQQPTVTGEGVNWADYWAEAVSAESQHSDIAWDFLHFASQGEQLRTFYEKCKESRDFGEIYPREDMASEIISDEYVGAYVKMAETSRSWRMVDKKKVSDEFEDLIKDITVSGDYSVENIQNKLQETAIVVDQIIAGS